jgi:hypothetical protein
VDRAELRLRVEESFDRIDQWLWRVRSNIS